MDQPLPPTRWAVERSVEERKAYTKRFERIAARGEDVDGEARFVDAIAARGATILDAGCGTGRLAAALCARGHLAVGVDADPLLIAAGQEAHPGVWLRTLDLTTVSTDTLAAAGLPAAYDVIVAAGNVLVYVAPGTEALVIERLSAVLVPGGRLLIGFHTDRDFTHDLLDQAAAIAGLEHEFRFGTWQADPFTSASDWATSVYRKPC